MKIQPTKILVCGSLAMDHLLRHTGSFKAYQETYEVEAMNASLPISDYRTCFGGCGGNIAYGLGVLGIPIVLLSHAGRDFTDSYQQHLLTHNVDCTYVAVDQAAPFSARCTILGDDFGNQITGFYPGHADPKCRSAANRVCEQTSADFGLLGPEAPELMLKQAAELHQVDVPFIFDPGQWISEFESSALERMLSYKAWVFGNEHELDVMTTLLETSLEALAQQLPVVVRTRGASGLDLYISGEYRFVQAKPAQTIADTTGSGDALRAGFLFGLYHGLDLIRAAELGTVVAAKSVEHMDPQGWVISRSGLLATLEPMH